MTNKQLARKCLDLAQNYHTIYVMGCLGYNMTKNNKTLMYNHHEWNRQPNRWKHINGAGDNRWGFDCVCMIKSLVWGWCADKTKSRGGGIYGSNGLSDVGANQIITDTWCFDVEVIDSCKTYDYSNIQSGEVVWQEGHVGLYIGAGKVVHCTPGGANCVQMADFNTMTWKKHGKLRCITYEAGNITSVTGAKYKSSASNLASNPDSDCTYSDASGSVPGISPSQNPSQNTSSVVSFTPRTTAPSRDDPWWISSTKGGKNNCIIVYGCSLADGKSCIPNCVGYAWGRFSEILGSPCKLSTGNAEDWWGYTSDGYERGQTPKLGAVICWSKGQVGYQYDDGAGHVAIVEKINDDGTIVTSESGWQSSTLWWTTTRSKGNGNWGASSAYKFQGFIYNPAVNGSWAIGPLEPREDRLHYFLEAAQELIGKGDFWTTIKQSFEDEKFSNGVKIKSQHDSIAYVMHCTRCVNGLLDVVIPDVASCSDVGKIGVENKYGFWHDGPANGKDDTWAYPGDIVHIRTLIKERDNKYSCEELGIVVNVIENGTKFEAAMCDYSSGVRLVTYKLDSDQIAGYYRPDWKQVDASVLNLLGYVFGLSVYTEISSREDAIIREVGYLNSSLEPSIRSSNIRLSVINYTSGISALFLASGGGIQFGGPSSSAQYSDLILEGFGNVECIILEQLMGYGMNAANAIGILANAYHESTFHPDAIGDNGNAYGLWQWNWHHEHFLATVPNWSTNVTGQVEYLWWDMNYRETDAWDKMKSLPNTKQGCREAASIFCLDFEKPSNKEVKAQIRADTAASYWDKIVPQLS